MALFKIYNNIDNPRRNEETGDTILPLEHHKGYMYFDALKSLFYIDVANDEDNVPTKRVALNSWLAYKAYGDEDGLSIKNNYLKISDAPTITVKTWTGIQT